MSEDPASAMSTWRGDGGLLEGELPVGEDPGDEWLGAPVGHPARARWPNADLLHALHVPLAHVEPAI